MGPTIPRPQQRFTMDGSPALESRLEQLCRSVRDVVLAAVPSRRLEGLVLGGGYGRGQGGVLKSESGDAPYNDLEFYAFFRGNRVVNEARYRRVLKNIEARLTPEAGLHVEFKIDSLAELRRRDVSIFSYDLVCGHRLLFGHEDLFVGCERHRDPKNISQSEATRLLLNRCSGLLLAQELLLKPTLSVQDCDFIGRNIAKAWLALGDALLAALGLYHWNCLERSRRLQAVSIRELDWLLDAVRPYHVKGVSFKLNPVRIVKPPAEFKAEHQAVSDLALREWLWIENRRLKANFINLREYAFSSIDKCHERRVWRNLLLNLRTFGAKASLDARAPRYPRERLFNALPLLLSDPAATAQPETRRHLQRQLFTRAEDWAGLVAAYKHVWSCYG
ncbi:MAG TPA: hypothetical protein VKY92_15100 [Verrucomicrobiae bacterium]|nr:hypothetical protein [Verrucomicrobiae bacterium]